MSTTKTLLGPPVPAGDQARHVRDRLLVSAHYQDVAAYLDGMADEIAELDGDTPEAVALYRHRGHLLSLATNAADVQVPDEFPAGAVVPWRCAHCESRWFRVSPMEAPPVVRLLHYDETCPCFGLHCECGGGSDD